MKRLPPGHPGFERLSEAVTTEFRALLDLVRQAVAEKVRATSGMADYYVDIQGVWPDRVVVCLKGRLYNYPYTLTAENVVQLGEGTEVVVNYQPVREAAAGSAAAFTEATDGTISVTIIRSGLSVNGNYYPDAALQAAVPLFEGVRVFSKSDAEHSKGAGKDVRNLLGGIYGVSFVPGSGPDTGALVGTFRAIDPADATVTKMVEAVRRGMAGLMGLSIDAEARCKREKRNGKTVRVAQQFARVHSVDLIVEPGAGGGLDRLTEAADDPDSDHDSAGETMKKRLLEALKLRNAALAATVDIDKITDEELLKLYESTFPAPTGADPVREAKPGAGAEPALTRADLELFQARAYVAPALAASNLPQAARDKLGAELRSRERLTEAQVDDAIKAEREYLAKFVESGRPTGGLPRIEVGDRTKTVADMLDAFFDPKHKDHRNVRSIRECYVEITGDRHVIGEVDRARLTESVGTDTLADVLGASMTRRLQADYREQIVWDGWREACVQAPVNDFRVQERTQMGGFGNLPTVAERAAYTALSDPTDDKATYSVAKRGGLIEVTMEMIKNDDVGALRRLPVAGSRAAKRTLYAFVYNFYASNPTIYDSVALYHASHNNLFTAALTGPQYAAHRLAMMKQTGRDTANRMGIGPSKLLVPLDLEETAADLFRRNTNNDKTFVQSLAPTIIPVATWTDVNDWVTLADQMDIPVLEIGFLDGAEEPTLLTQDSPTEGKVFTNDMITYKLRHIYGGNILVDGFKGTTKAVVP